MTNLMIVFTMFCPYMRLWTEWSHLYFWVLWLGALRSSVCVLFQQALRRTFSMHYTREHGTTSAAFAESLGI